MPELFLENERFRRVSLLFFSFVGVILILGGTVACGPHFDSYEGHRAQFEVGGAQKVSLHTYRVTESSDFGRCTGGLVLLLDTTTNQFKLTECDAGKLPMTQAFTMREPTRKNIEKELGKLVVKRFSVPVTNGCLNSSAVGASKIVLLSMSGSEEVLVSSHALSLDGACKNPIVVHGVYDSNQALDVIQGIQIAASKS